MTDQQQPADVPARAAEVVPVAELRPHPRNYRSHPEDQREHLRASLREHGFYRNVVVARDGTILAGHGVVQAARDLGVERIPVVRFDLAHDDPRALRVLAGDNEVMRFAEVDDRALTELLRDVEEAAGLLGTGYDEAMLANLVMVTRPASEIASSDEAAAWVGMPSFEPTTFVRLTVLFENEEKMAEFMRLVGIETISKKMGNASSCWWPPRPKNDLMAEGFVDVGAATP